MRRIGVPYAILSVIPFILFLVATLVPQWHSYAVNSSSTVNFGLYEICTDGHCRKYGDPSLGNSLTFDPCYLISGGSDIHYCEFRVATFGTMISSVVLSFLGIVFAFWALRYHRDFLYTWGSYYLVALCQFIAFIESLVGCILYGYTISQWNSSSLHPQFNLQSAFLCAIAACILTLILLIAGIVLARLDHKKQYLREYHPSQQSAKLMDEPYYTNTGSAASMTTRPLPPRPMSSRSKQSTRTSLNTTL